MLSVVVTVDGVKKTIANVGSTFTVTCKTVETLPSSGHTWEWTLSGPNSVSETRNTNSEFTHTITAATEHNGEYSCALKFDDIAVPAKKVTIYVRTVELNPTFSTAADSWTDTIGSSTYALLTTVGISVTLTCEFHGDAVTSLWLKNEGQGPGAQPLTTGGDYVVASSSVDYVHTTTLTINANTDATNNGFYECLGTYTSEVQVISRAYKLMFLGIESLVSSKPYADVSDTVTYTCTPYPNQAATYAWSGRLKPKSGNIVSETMTDKTFNGDVTCTVTFTFPDETLLSTKTIRQYVRFVELTSTALVVDGQHYLVAGKEASITCTAHGDILSKEPAWTPADTGTAAQTAREEADYLTESVLTLTSITATTTFTCAVSYTEGPMDRTKELSLEFLRKLNITLYWAIG